MFHGHLDYFPKPPLGGRPNTKPRSHGNSKRSQPLIYSILSCVRTRINRIHWNSIWLRAQSHMASHNTRGSMTTLHDFGGVSGRPLHTFFWALTISQSRLLACVWGGPDMYSPPMLVSRHNLSNIYYHNNKLQICFSSDYCYMDESTKVISFCDLILTQDNLHG
jgi:hypothetical protein